ncbi:hypothetical protein [Helicobacter sp. 23-1045]
MRYFVEILRFCAIFCIFTLDFANFVRFAESNLYCHSKQVKRAKNLKNNPSLRDSAFFYANRRI